MLPKVPYHGNMKHLERPYYRNKYQFELAVELTGRNKRAIQMLMRRKEFSLVEAIKYYSDKNQGG